MVSPGSYRAGRMFCRDGYDWCRDSDRRGGNRVRRADPGPVSTGCSRTGRPVVYKPMLVPEDLAFVPSRRCTVWVWGFSSFTYSVVSRVSHFLMGGSDVMTSLRYSRTHGVITCS